MYVPLHAQTNDVNVQAELTRERMDETRLARPGHAMQEITAAVRNTTFSIPLFIQSLFSRADSQVLENSREKRKRKKGGVNVRLLIAKSPCNPLRSCPSPQVPARWNSAGVSVARRSSASTHIGPRGRCAPGAPRPPRTASSPRLRDA